MTLTLSTAVRAAEPATSAAEPVTPARALFKEARELVTQGDYRAACPKFEQSLALESGLGTQFNLADCWEHIGRTASAQALFIGAAASAKAAGQSEREQILRDRAAALEPRISHLVIEVEDSDPKLVVKRGDLPLDSDVYGKAKAVDPGHYEITAKAPGKRLWQSSVEVLPGTSVVTVKVPLLEPQPTEAAAKPAKEPAHQSSPPPVSPAATSTAPRGGTNLAALGLAGIGLGGLVLGTVMTAKYSSANSDAKNICPTSHDCTVQQIADHDRRVEDARGERLWAVVGFGAGGLGLAAAAALLFLPHSSNEHTGWIASPVVANNGTFGANLSGNF